MEITPRFSPSKRSIHHSEEVLTVVQSGGGGVDKNARNLRKSVLTFIVVQQPKEIWTKGDDNAV
jgi:hypothetical protein